MKIRRYQYDGSQDVCAICLDKYLMKQVNMKKYILTKQLCVKMRYQYDGSPDVCAICRDKYLMKRVYMKKYILTSEVLCEDKKISVSWE